MKMLCLLKYFVGLDFGLFLLMLCVWFEVVYGKDVYESFDKMLWQDWMFYFDWYCSIMQFDVFNCISLINIFYYDGWLWFDFEIDSVFCQIECRRLIFVIGIDGGGVLLILDMVCVFLKDIWIYSVEIVDDDYLKDCDIVIFGLVIFSFDWVVMVFEKGVKSVMMIGCLCSFGCIEVLVWMNFFGFLGYFFELLDLIKW